MIISLNNILKEACLPYTSYKIGVQVEENKSGNDIYPLTYIELPIISDIEVSDGIRYNSKIIMYVVTQRIEKTEEETLIQLNDMYNITSQILLSLQDYITNVSLLTYTGIVDNQFSDDCNGVRVEFTIIHYYKCE